MSLFSLSVMFVVWLVGADGWVEEHFQLRPRPRCKFIQEVPGCRDRLLKNPVWAQETGVVGDLGRARDGVGFVRLVPISDQQPQGTLFQIERTVASFGVQETECGSRTRSAAFVGKWVRVELHV